MKPTLKPRPTEYMIRPPKYTKQEAAQNASTQPLSAVVCRHSPVNLPKLPASTSEGNYEDPIPEVADMHKDQDEVLSDSTLSDSDEAAKAAEATKAAAKNKFDKLAEIEKVKAHENLVKSADSNMMVKIIDFILESGSDSTSNGTRVINMLFCAAGGLGTFSLAMYPETHVVVEDKNFSRSLSSCATKLCQLEPHERIEYLNVLYDGLRKHLKDFKGLRLELANMIKNLKGEKDDEIRAALRPLYNALETELQRGLG
jgi:hypothetical protein